MEENRLSVSRLNMLISQELKLSPFLRNVHAEGELARFVRHGRGHLYFTLKDDYSSIDCMMYESDARRLSAPLEEGDRVALTGRVEIYEKNAKLQFYVRTMHPLGEGVYLRQFAMLREKLEAEGLLDPAKKRALPRYPGRVALLTSETGAARSDFLKIFRSRNPLAEVVLLPVPLQGDGAAEAIVEVLEAIEDLDFDLVVLTRGGGSYEDLREFNSEPLARLLAAYAIPTICAVGHEIDLTMAELAASARGATPSEAAQLATDDLFKALASHQAALMNSLARTRERAAHFQQRLRLEVLENLQFAFFKRSARVAARIEEQRQALTAALRYRLKSEGKQLTAAAGQLDALSPLKVLARGYALVRKDGEPLRSLDGLSAGDRIETTMTGGRILSAVEEIIHEIQ